VPLGCGISLAYTHLATVIFSLPKSLIEMSVSLVDNFQNIWGNEKMNTESDNLVRLDQWKNSKRDSCFSDYLKVLSFNDLMSESTDLLDQMRKNEESENLFSKTRIMMNEFTNRLEKESRHLADSVKDLKKQIEDKLH